MNYFDFEQHRAKAIESFGAVRDSYERFALVIQSILKVALKDLSTHHISVRAKSIESFAKKATKPHPDDPTRPRYSDPVREIEDLAGARVITYVLRTLARVDEVVQREFDVVEKMDKGRHLDENAQVGYRSIHYIIKLKPDRAALLEYKEFAELRAEVQIRTILQHAWAEIEHDMRYKPASEPNKQLSQRLTALAGMIEVGDREFDQIYEIDARRKKELLDLAQMNESVPEPTHDRGELPSGLPQPQGKSEHPGRTAIEHRPGDQPKKLMNEGRYADAIVQYNTLIHNEPNQFSHYLGRSKARFLNGDTSGALQDLDAAERISPGHPSAVRVRSLIEGGPIGAGFAGDYQLALRQGHNAIRDGDPAQALQCYEEAERLGFSPVLSVFNRAMARFLGREFDLAEQTLDRIDPYPGSALEFNVFVLRILCYLMAGGDDVAGAARVVEDELIKVRRKLAYEYNARSPLASLESGLKRVMTVGEMEKMEQIFKVLQSANPTANATGSALRPPSASVPPPDPNAEAASALASTPSAESSLNA